MSTLILHGAALTATEATALAVELQGGVEEQPGFLRLHTPQPVSDERLVVLRERAAFDINRLPLGFDPATVRLLVTDMDSTLINIECIDEIADFAGLKPQVATITAAAMRGELNFEQSLTQRVALLKGVSQDALQRVYQERLQPNPGAATMLAGLKARGIAVGLVSGGFTFFTERLKTRLALDYARANVLEINDAKLTGRVLGTIVGALGKAAFLEELCAQSGITPQQTVAMGDGANDLEMMRRAGLSIAYRAKPAVQAQAHCVINHGDLTGVLALLGIALT